MDDTTDSVDSCSQNRSTIHPAPSNRLAVFRSRSTFEATFAAENSEGAF
jgi:hypothetical protein